jgi:hypothetical protein
LEQARRATLAHHVHRFAPLGARVLINETWYKRFADQFVGEVTEHGLDAVTREINTAGLVNDDYGIRIFL